MTSARIRSFLAGLLAAALVPQAQEARADDDGPQSIQMRTLSTHADRVSGGDVLVEISLPRAPRKGDVIVSLNGQVVTGAFRETAPGSLVGLVSGLSLGENRLTAEAKGVGTKSLRLVNYPITGPIISGPHEQVGSQKRPFVCQTSTFALPDGSTLGPAKDADCSADTKVTYVYLPAGSSAFKPLPSTKTLPADVAMTTTLAGVKMPYVVRVETGTINRGIDQVAVLHDPTSEAPPSPFAAPKGWNRKLIAVQGFGCPGGWYIQGGAQGNLALPGVIRAELLDTARLGEGYAIFANTLQHPSNNCNALLGGETMMMSKEHFIEEFGVPRATLSVGCSGGSYTSLQYGDSFPGLIDGVLIACTFPDAMAIALSGSDGHLLTHYFTATNPTGFTDAQQVAVSGYKASAGADIKRAWYDAANQSGRTDPVPARPDVAGYVSSPWSAVVPAGLRYDPATNRTGARATVYDVGRNVFGIDGSTGFARRPFDNVGVQYGLAALNSGQITKEQFLDLNERVGGYDQDANYVASRVAGDVGAIERMQESGITLGGSGGMSEVPVFDISGIYNDDAGYHYQWYHFATRERLREVNGNSDNHVMWRGNPVPFDTAWATFTQWVEAVKADASDVSQRRKVLRNKPAQAVDGCWSSSTNFIAEAQTFSSKPDSRCNTLFPTFAFPRYIAGGPLKANVYKCRLKSIDPGDYTVAFTPAELARLHAAFPGGVCDYSQRGVGYRRTVTWPSFGPSRDNLVFDVTNPDRRTSDDDD
ncbi:MAG TPA: DUF6351 family protein [Myxococcales bacterium]|nr:DUF6351 family protein [Myxococcales bacterium]